MEPFIWRRLHSLAGLWFVLFLFEHLLTNSQAALLLGDHGQGFVRMVNTLHNLPYLQAIEIFLLGVPFALHMVLGVKYLFTSKMNGYPYERNRAYNWQRISSWVLLIGIVIHIIEFRFLEYPKTLDFDDRQAYVVSLSVDKQLDILAPRLGVQLYGQEQIEKERVLKKMQAGSVIAVAPDFGTATLLTVRNAFKSPLYAIFYTLFVLAACFHGLNGLWTFLITWGVVLRFAAQQAALKVTWTLMALVTFLGLAAIWGTYFSL